MRRSNLRLWWTSAFVVALGCQSVRAQIAGARLQAPQDIRFPRDAGVIDVTQPPYNAKGDGVTDDTASIQKAISENVGRPYNYAGARTLYFPNGTYLVSKTLVAKNAQGIWKAFLVLQGQSRDKTILKLRDNAPDFQDAAKPHGVVHTASDANHPAKPDDLGFGNAGFTNCISDMTIDTGRGNAGASGLFHAQSNQGVLKNLRIRSGDGSGFAGLDLTVYGGPGFLKNVEVQGFRYGIYLAAWTTSVVAEHITLRDQTECGIFVPAIKQATLTLRGLHSINRVPAIRHFDERGLMTLVDCRLEGGAAANIAVENRGAMFLRNIHSSGYGATLQSGSENIVSGRIEEWTSHQPLSLFGGTGKSLNLPVRETPEVYDPDLQNWASVVAFGANPNDDKDDTAAIQAAIDSGKNTIYFPSPQQREGAYIIDGTVRVRGNVRRIDGLYARIQPRASKGFRFPEEKRPVFRFEGGSSPVVLFQRFDMVEWPYDSAGTISIEHASPQTLVIKNGIIESYRNQPGAGPLFLEDVVSHWTISNWRFDHQDVWARNFNPEDMHDAQIINNGGRVWMLGLKFESLGPLLQTYNGGQTELLGALLTATVPAPPGVPIFVTQDSSLSFSGVHYAWDGDQAGRKSYDFLLRETQNGQTRELHNTDIPHRLPNAQDELARRAYFVPLYSSATATPQRAGSLPEISVSATHPDAVEGGARGQFTLTRQGNSSRALAIRYSVTGSARSGSDYAPLSGKAIIAAGKTSVVIPVVVNDDKASETTERLTIQLQPFATYRVGWPAIATVSIADNDTKVLLPPQEGLGVWLRADGPLRLNDKREVERWLDSGVQGNHAYFPPHTHFARWDQTALNGRPALRFQGDWFFLPPVDTLTQKGPYGEKTIVAVFKTSHNLSGTQAIVSQGMGDSSVAIYVHEGELFWNAPGQGTSAPFLRVKLQPDSAYLATLVMSKKGNSFEAFLNGSSVGKLAGAGEISGTSTLQRHFYTVGSGYRGAEIHQGYSADHGGFWFDGWIAELLDYGRALTAEELKVLHDQLRERYSLEVPNR